MKDAHVAHECHRSGFATEQIVPGKWDGARESIGKFSSIAEMVTLLAPPDGIVAGGNCGVLGRLIVRIYMAGGLIVDA
jgi:hypothetical protein